ncbi:hypothetical protein LTR05_002471 [Lithohypha guttulata]|uniref:Uncharacterized protein n=1 Tax=Lithohypha guttulata TaxID=1690604 RepID=A0AAN7T3D5_9EURO|nr:hypothetical protein LTR05_002471 [Lithohypha guttulata]
MSVDGIAATLSSETDFLSTNNTVSKPSLLCIPVEIRYKIYEHFVSDETTPRGKRRQQHVFDVNLLQVCSQIRYEACQFLSTGNQWVKFTRYSSMPSTPPTLPFHVLFDEVPYVPEYLVPAENKADLEDRTKIHLSERATEDMTLHSCSCFFICSEISWLNFCSNIASLTSISIPKSITMNFKSLSSKAEAISGYLLPLLQIRGVASVTFEPKDNLLDIFAQKMQSQRTSIYEIQEVLLAFEEAGNLRTGLAARSFYKAGLRIAKQHFDGMLPWSLTSPARVSALAIAMDLINAYSLVTLKYLLYIDGYDPTSFAHAAFNLLDDCLVASHMVTNWSGASKRNRFDAYRWRANAYRALQNVMFDPPSNCDPETLTLSPLEGSGPRVRPTRIELVVLEARACRLAYRLAPDDFEEEFWDSRYRAVLSKLDMPRNIFESHTNLLDFGRKNDVYESRIIRRWAQEDVTTTARLGASEYLADLHTYEDDDLRAMAQEIGVKYEDTRGLFRLLVPHDD